MKQYKRQVLEILQMTEDGVDCDVIAKKFNMWPQQICNIQRQARLKKEKANRRIKLREEMRSADDPEKRWPVNDVLDALGLVTVTKKRLMTHLKDAGEDQISLLELMTMCSDGEDGWPDLLKVYGVGKIGYWMTVNGLTKMQLGERCQKEWEPRLARINAKMGVTPYWDREQ